MSAPRRIYVKLALAACLLAAAQGAGAAVTTIAAARLKVEASHALPRHVLRGMVTAFSGWKNSFFLQDETGAISVDRLDRTAVFVGDQVEVTGTITPGFFAPVMVSDAVKVLAPGKMPTPRRAAYYELSRGELDSELVEVSGVVHSARVGEIWDRQVLFLDLRTLDGGEITVHVLEFPEDYGYLVDSAVRIRGVCGTVFNNRQQLVGIRLFVPNLKQIAVESAPVDPFSLPLTPLERLLRFDPHASLEHRVRIAGVVTFQAPGHALYLQNGGSGVRVDTRQGGRFELGERVEASGFAAADGYSPVLEDAVVRAVGRGVAPTPVRVLAAQVITARDGFAFAPYDGLLVHLEGKVLERLPQTQGQLWQLADQQIEFQAEMSEAGDGSRKIEAGTWVGLTGICRTEADGHGNPRSFRILLRNEGDITLLRRAYSNVSIAFLATALALVLGIGLLVLWLQEGYSGRARQQAEASPLSESRMAAFARFSRWTGVAAGSLGALVLVGWQIGNPLLKSVLPHYVSMKANTAAAFVAFGLALWGASRSGSKGGMALARVGAGVAAAVGGLTLAEHLTGWNLHIDELLFRQGGALVATSSPGRMALTSALCLLLLGTAMLMLRRRRLIALAQCLALLAGSAALLSLNSYVFGIHDFPGISRYSALALHTAAGMLLLSLGVLAYRADSGLMRAVSAPAPGGVMAVWLLPCTLFLPSILGWIRWQGQLHGFYDTAFGLALFATANAICFGFLIWSTASLLNRLDRARSGSEAELRSLNETLEARIAERTSELALEREKLQSVLDAATSVSIIAARVDGVITVFNSGAENMLGYSAEEMVGKCTPGVFHLESEVVARGAELTAEMGKPVHGFDVFVERARQGQPEEREWTYVRRDGGQLTVNLVVTALRDASGEIAGFLGIAMDVSARKRAEAIVREGEERFRTIIETVKDYSIMTLDPAGNIVTWNSGAERQNGYKAEEILGKHIATFYSAEQRELDLPGAELRVAETTGECRQEGWRVRKDGRRFWASALITAVRDEHGRLRGFSKITQDLTEQKRAEERLRLVVEAAPNAVMMIDSGDCLALVNSQTEKLFGYERGELLGQRVEMLLPERLRHNAGGSFFTSQPAAAEGQPELFGLRSDGSEVPIEISSNPILSEEGRFVLASVVDVSERKRIEQSLREQARMLDMANDGIFICDGQERILYWNQGAERMYGWSKEEAVGQVPRVLLKTQTLKPVDEIRAELLARGHWKGEFVHTRRDGSLVTVTSALTYRAEEAERPASILCINHDVTEQKRADTALKEARRLLQLRVAELADTNKELARKNEEVEAFVYIVSHDLRTPLVNLQGFCKELELSCEELRESLPAAGRPADGGRLETILNEDIPGSLRYITASTTKFHRLINALLELSRCGRQEYQTEEIDLAALVQSTLDLLRLSIAAEGVRVSVGAIPKVQGDATALGQVFGNLIGNALKYRQPGRPGHIEIGGEMADGEAHCWVRDNGAGLPASAKKRLFQVFQRFHPSLAEGEGMGLAFVKRIVERHGGRIWAEGEEGVGSTFHFTLPANQPGQPAVEEGAREGSIEGSLARIG